MMTSDVSFPTSEDSGRWHLRSRGWQSLMMSPRVMCRFRRIFGIAGNNLSRLKLFRTPEPFPFRLSANCFPERIYHWPAIPFRRWSVQPASSDNALHRSLSLRIASATGAHSPPSPPAPAPLSGGYCRESGLPFTTGHHQCRHGCDAVFRKCVGSI